jgi:dephospho-CoA kinase
MRSLSIGITGGIGSGKSTVCRVFQVLGVPVYDADSRAKWLMNHDSVLREQVSAAFGPESYLPNGTLNRVYLAGRVFNDESETQKLNSLVHPRVGEDYQTWRKSHAQAAYTLREAALLFEAGATRDLDAVIVVSAPRALRIRRVLHRDPHRTEADVAAIMARQMPEEEKTRRANHLIHNDETQLVITQVMALDAVFRQR